VGELEVRFATSADGTRIAFAIGGEGPPLLFITSWGATAAHHVSPWIRAWVDRVGAGRQLAIMDRRGTGASQRQIASLSLEAQLEDIASVADRARWTRLNIFAVADAAALAVAFAARHPERVGRIVLWCPFVAGDQLGGQPILSGTADLMERNFPLALRAYAEIVIPSGTADELRRYREDLRRDAPAELWPLHYKFISTLDVRADLPLVQAPVLVFHRTGAIGVPLEAGRSVAAALPDARLIALEGDSSHQSLGDQSYLESLFAFLDADRVPAPARAASRTESDRVLATALFTDIVGATKRMAAVGDRGWRELITRHHELVRNELERFRGREIDTAGDGFFAAFDRPEQALRCARAIGAVVRELGIQVRAGVHIGECELIDGKLGGIAVHIAARVAQLASADEVLVSSTLKESVAGSGIGFRDLGIHCLRGIPGEWRIFAVDLATVQAP
jgi:class 3 adenylate cyclase